MYIIHLIFYFILVLFIREFHENESSICCLNKTGLKWKNFTGRFDNSKNDKSDFTKSISNRYAYQYFVEKLFDALQRIRTEHGKAILKHSSA